MKIRRITAALLALTIAASSSVSLYGSAVTPDSPSSNVSVSKNAENAPASPVFTDAVRTPEGAQFSWSRVSGVDGYMLYHYNQTGGYKHVILGADVTTYLWRDFDPTYTYAIVSYINVGSETIKSSPTIINGSDIENAGSAAVQAPQMPEYLKMGRGKTALRVYWQPLECDGVEVWIRKENETWTLAGYDTAGASNFRVGDLAPGTRYQFRIRAYNTDSSGNKVFSVYNANIFASTLEDNVAKPATVKITSAGKSSNAVRIYWESVPCSGYEVYIFKNNQWVHAGNAGPNDTNMRVEGLSPNTAYWLTVRAFNKSTISDTIVYGDYSANKKVTTKAAASTVTAPDPVDIIKISKGSTAIRLTWTPQNVDGYEVYRKVGGTYIYSDTVDGNADNIRYGGLTPSTAYYFKVRAFRLNNGNKVYGDFSRNVKATTKAAAVTVTAPDPVDIVKISKGKTAIRLTWTPQSVDGYEVYRKVGGTYVYSDTVAGNADNIRYGGLTPSTAYYFKVRAYRLDGSGNKVYGDFSRNVKATTKDDPNAVKIENKNGVTYVNGVLIVNKTYSVPASYGPGGLTSETAAAFSRMQSAAARDGLSLWCASGYRSYSYQSTLYNNYVARDGRAAADRYSARPGHSEHQTGLALDVNDPSSSFNNTREARWLAQHCAEYGFIIRYPDGKESSTGFKYEPWHIRYLGTDLAQKVTASGKTLEEYFGITSVYS